MNSNSADIGRRQYDRAEIKGRSLIQHGKINDRIYLMKLSKDDYPAIIDMMDTLAGRKGYTKIIAKVPAWAEEGFTSAGYSGEAHVPGFFLGTEDAFFMSKFLDRERALQADPARLSDILSHALSTPALTAPPSLEQCFEHRIVTLFEIDALADIYGDVFETYPFPIYEPDYLRSAIKNNTVYFTIWDGGKIAAAASCEMDVSSLNVEMTDFATRPAYRSQGLASYLLYTMGQEMIKRGIRTTYTIARSASYGMNITFAKHGYAYSGTLVNNTNISGGLASMNVWYKTLMQENG